MYLAPIAASIRTLIVCGLVCVAAPAGAQATPLGSRISAARLECVTRGGRKLIGRSDHKKLWGKVLRSRSEIERELYAVAKQIKKAERDVRGVREQIALRNLRIKRADLQTLLARYKVCFEQRVPVATVTVTPTPTNTPLPTSAPTLTPTPAEPSPTPTVTPIPAKVPVFIAQGHAGRLIISCDDGRSWINNADQTVSPEVRCWNGAIIAVGNDRDVFGCTDNTCDDCDHQNWAGRGLAYGDGAFVATWGWGKPGKVQRSVDGVHWTTVLAETRFADVAFGNGVFMTGTGRPYHSQDNGISWSPVMVPNGYSQYYNVRAIGFGNWAPGSHFYIFGDGDRLHAIDSGGSTITSPAHPLGCASYLSGSASSDDVIVTTHSDYSAHQGYTCRSADGGQTWTRQDIVSVQTLSSIFWTGSEFVFWGDSARIYRSADGATWSAQPLVADNFGSFPTFGAMARSDAGSMVMVNGDWTRWYEQQRFYRSTDGVHWTQLPTASFVGSHPLNFVEFGYVDSTAQGCHP